MNQVPEDVSERIRGYLAEAKALPKPKAPLLRPELPVIRAGEELAKAFQKASGRAVARGLVYAPTPGLKDPKKVAQNAANAYWLKFVSGKLSVRKAGEWLILNKISPFAWVEWCMATWHHYGPDNANTIPPWTWALSTKTMDKNQQACRSFALRRPWGNAELVTYGPTLPEQLALRHYLQLVREKYDAGEIALDRLRQWSTSNQLAGYVTAAVAAETTRSHTWIEQAKAWEDIW